MTDQEQAKAKRRITHDHFHAQTASALVEHARRSLSIWHARTAFLTAVADRTQPGGGSTQDRSVFADQCRKLIEEVELGQDELIRALANQPQGILEHPRVVDIQNGIEKVAGTLASTLQRLQEERPDSLQEKR
jgi:hypothetical protein